MEFAVFHNDKTERPYILAPGEVFMYTQYGQLLLANDNDGSVTLIPKKDNYIIVFENPDELPLSATIRLVY